MSPRGARRLGAALGVVLGLAAPGPSRAEPDPAPEAAAEAFSDVPAGEATLRGRVVHVERPAAAAGVEVVLYSLSRQGSPGSRRVRSDETGGFTFPAISNDPEVVYLLGARHAELPFPGDRVVFEAGETERTVEIRISDPSEDASAVRVLQSSVRIEWSGDRLAVGEVHRLRNDGTRVFHLRPGRRAGRRAPLHAILPAGATEFAMPLGLVPEGVVREGDDFRFWGPLYPGEQEISFRYEVPIEPGRRELVKRFASPADRVRIFARENGPLEAVDGLAPGEVVEDQGLRFQPWEAASVAAGLHSTLHLSIPETRTDPGAVSLVESQWVLEVDDVTLQAQEQHRIEVTEGPVVQAPSGGLLLRLPLPDGAEDVRFSADSTSLGLVRVDGGIGLTGPLSPGSHGLGVAYSLRAGPEGVRFERSFDRRLPLLRVYVADSGVVVETDRLHRRRPVRDADRTFLLFEAYEVAADEPLAFGLRALAPRAGSGRAARAVALLAGIAIVVFLLAPLGGAARPAAPAEAETPAVRRERAALYQSIRDLDHDFETGKLVESDWQALRAELRGQAVALLAQERRAAELDRDASPQAVAQPACAACGAAARDGDRFCPQCGADLSSKAPAA